MTLLTFSSVADPSHFDVDPDPDPRIHLSVIVDPDPRIHIWKKVDPDPDLDPSTLNIFRL